MGIDIHMFIVKNGKALSKNLYDGRDYDWFSNLSKKGNNPVYDKFFVEGGLSPQVPEEWNDKYDKIGYYDFYHISVKNFKDWYQKYRPDKMAGWVDTYTKWVINKRGYIPFEDDYKIKYSLDRDDILEDMVFIEFTNDWEPSNEIFKYLIENNIPDDADLTYFFDR